MTTKIKSLPFTTLKKHFEGETFAPVEVNGVYELQSALSVLAGIKGNPYGFATAENANKWLDDSLIKTSKTSETKQSHIDKLIIANSINPSDYLETEINVIEARNAGEWSIYFYDDLLLEWGEVAKGDKGDTGLQGVKGDTGLQGIQGVKGDTGLQGIQGVKGDTGLQGIQGVKGDTGLQGVKGDTGLQGIQGVKGDKGDAGVAGAAGITWQYPIGYLLIDTSNTNPLTFLGYGTWAAFGAGRVLVGQDTAQTEFDVLGETGGEKTHVLTAAEMPAHTHTGSFTFNRSAGFTAAGVANNGPNTANTGSAGADGAHNNLQPYIVVKFWKRTA